MSNVRTSVKVAAPGRRARGMDHRSAMRAHQTGVGLIEVMIAVLILSIAFLGMAALQARSLSTNNSSMARSMATIAVHSIQDAMRADIINATGGVYNGTITADKCPAADGTLAGSQLNQWCSNQLASPMLGGAVSTTSGMINCTSTGFCTVTVSFDDTKAGAVGNNTSQGVTTRGIL